jgi:hypothetical protein
MTLTMNIILTNCVLFIWFLGSIIMIIYGAVYCSVKIRTNECPKNCYYKVCSQYEEYDDDYTPHTTKGYFIYGTCSCPRVNPDKTIVYSCSNYETYTKINAGYIVLLVFGIIMLLTSVMLFIKYKIELKNYDITLNQIYIRQLDEINDNVEPKPSAPIYSTSPLHTLPLAEAL